MKALDLQLEQRRLDDDRDTVALAEDDRVGALNVCCDLRRLWFTFPQVDETLTGRPALRRLP